MEQHVWVLMKEQGDYTTPIGAYRRKNGLLDRLDRIEQRNKPYEMERLGENAWRIGPEFKEGFFGHNPVFLTAVLTKLED